MERESLVGCLVILGLLSRDAHAVDALRDKAVQAMPSESALLVARRLAKKAGLRLRFRRRTLAHLGDQDLPLAFRTADGTWQVLVKLASDKALVQNPAGGPPVLISHADLESRWDGTVAWLRGGGRFDVRWFIPEFIRYRSLFAQVLLASFVLQVLALVTPLFFQVVMDKVVVQNSLSTLDVLAMTIAAVAVMEVTLKAARDYLMTHTTTRIDAGLGIGLFERLMALPLAYFKARSVGVTAMRMRELEIIRGFLSGAGNTLTIDLLAMVVFFGVMAHYSVFLTGIVLSAVPVLFLIAWAVTPTLNARIEALSHHSALNSALLNETVAGAETVKALTLEPQMAARWEEQTRDYVYANHRVQLLQSFSEQAVQGVQKIALALVLWLGARMVIGLELSIGQLIAFNMMANHVMQPIVRLAEVWRDYVQARVAVHRLGDVLNTTPERASGTALPETGSGAIRLEAVSFAYSSDRAPVLDGLDMHIPAGALVGLVGESGSGKTTIAKLLQKLYVPDGGRISIDGRDIGAIDIRSLRRTVGVVSQDSFLFNRSVRANIALTDPAAPMDRVVAAAKAAGAHDFILNLPEGYDTVLSEGGRSLSGGECQRIAIARTLMTDARILILDEATSALDEESQALIRHNMGLIRKGRTVIVIAHRLSAVRDCDVIHVMERGRIVESGCHEDLIARPGRYARLWAGQTRRHSHRRGAASQAVTVFSPADAD